MCLAYLSIKARRGNSFPASDEAKICITREWILFVLSIHVNKELDICDLKSV